ncbi:hypothetical protein EAI26_06975 [Lactobacillus sp. 0.1XD8-4]|uniref:Uncharacterized protein n=1 Tax=Limosilactobacillus walteri TaxID=2268022 RepID=A0ABR8P9M7_9LACO|nr:hypothetical protein [Limosilactobacillus walteri]MRN07129.1 hypothetical protein [Lactobacillus sp. 0.1XD8-4]
MTKPHKDSQYNINSIKNDLCGYTFALFIMLGGIVSGDSIPWEWLKEVIHFCFIVTLFEEMCSLYRYIKLKKQLSH